MCIMYLLCVPQVLLVGGALSHGLMVSQAPEGSLQKHSVHVVIVVHQNIFCFEYSHVRSSLAALYEQAH